MARARGWALIALTAATAGLIASEAGAQQQPVATSSVGGGMTLVDISGPHLAGGLDDGGTPARGRPSGQASTILTVSLPGVIAAGDSLVVRVHDRLADEAAFCNTLPSSDGQIADGVLGPVRRELRSSVADLLPNSLGVLRIDLGPLGQALDAGTYPVSVELATSASQVVGRLVTYLVIASPPAEAQPSPPAEARTSPVRVVLYADVPDEPEPHSWARWLQVLAQHADLPILASVTPTQVRAAAMNETAGGDQSSSEAAALGALAERAPQSQLQLAATTYVRADISWLSEAGLGTEVDRLYELGAQVLGAYGTAAPPELGDPRQAANAQQLATQADRGAENVLVRPDALIDNNPTPQETCEAAAPWPRRPVDLTSGQQTVLGLVLEQPPGSHVDETAGATAARAGGWLATALEGLAPGAVVAIEITGDDVSPQAASDLLDFLRNLNQLGAIELVDAATGFNQPASSDASNQPPAVLELVERPDNPATDDPATDNPVGNNEADYQAYLDTIALLDAYRSMVEGQDGSPPGVGGGEQPSADGTAAYESLWADTLGTLADDVSVPQRSQQLDAVAAQLLGPLSAVDIIADDTIRLTARTAPVPLSFNNHTSNSLLLRVRLAGERITAVDFDDGETSMLWLEPGLTTHEFTLQTLGSGRYTMQVELEAPTGDLQVGTKTVVIQSTAPTGVGLVLFFGAIGVLVLWWFVDRRRTGRRRTR